MEAVAQAECTGTPSWGGDRRINLTSAACSAQGSVIGDRRPDPMGGSFRRQRLPGYQILLSDWLEDTLTAATGSHDPLSCLSQTWARSSECNSHGADSIARSQGVKGYPEHQEHAAQIEVCCMIRRSLL